MTRNYLVKFTGVMMPSGRQISVDGLNLMFSPDKLIIDVYDELKEKSGIDPQSDKFMSMLNGIYADLIGKHRCEPYFSTENAKQVLIDTRNDDLLIAMQKEQGAKVEELVTEMSDKQRKLRRQLDKDAEVLKQKLVADMISSKGEVSKDELFIFEKKSELNKNPEMPQTEVILMKEEIAKAQGRIEAFRAKMARQEVTIQAEVDKLKESRELDIKAVETEYMGIIEKLKIKQSKELKEKVSFLVSRRDAEIALIDKIINFEDIDALKVAKSK